MKKYNVIYADPPWSYKNKKTGGSFKSGSEIKYNTMTLEDIKNMPLKNITQKNAVCFLWVTVPLLPEGMEVLKAWGFKYKTMLTWRKIMSLGMGYWFRGQCEHLLLGVKGNVKAFRMQKANFHESKAGRHSEKPDYFRQLITGAVTKTIERPVKLELFARENSTGWDVYGDQVNNSIKIEQ